MRFGNFILTIAIQAIGTCAAFLSSLVITREMGLNAQGEYSLIKSWTDAISVIFLYGLPQSFLDMSFQKEKSEYSLYKLAQRYMFILMVIGIIVGGLGYGYKYIFWISIAIPLIVFHGLVRSLLLRTGGEIEYALVTVIPAISLFSLIIIDFQSKNFPIYIFLSALFSAFWAWRYAESQKWQSGKLIMFKDVALNSISLHAFLLNIFPALQAAVFLTIAAMITVDKKEVGELSLVLIMLQLVAVAASFAAPVIYKFFDPGKFRDIFSRKKMRFIYLFFGIITLSLLVLCLFIPELLKIIFNVYSETLVYACRVAVFAGIFLFLSRLLGTVFQKMSYFSKLSISSVIRLFVSTMLLYALTNSLGLTISESGSLSILVSELVVFCWLLFLLISDYLKINMESNL